MGAHVRPHLCGVYPVAVNVNGQSMAKNQDWVRGCDIKSGSVPEVRKRELGTGTETREGGV